MPKQIANTEQRYKALVERVLSHHNNNYRTNIAILGRCEDIYLDLKGKTNWDWACNDETKHIKVAIEVKRLTIPELEKRKSVLNQIGKKLSSELSGKLSGTFFLHIGIPEETINPEGANKGKLTSALKELICEAAKRLGMKEEKELTRSLNSKLPYQLPKGCTFTISKYSNKGSHISIGPHYAGWAPTGSLEGKELEEFRKLILGANKQLASAKEKGISDTILIIVEQGFSFAEADVIQETLKVLNPLDYKDIKYIYRISGNEVQEILPSDERNNELNEDSSQSSKAANLARMVVEFDSPSEPPDTG